MFTESRFQGHGASFCPSSTTTIDQPRSVLHLDIQVGLECQSSHEDVAPLSVHQRQALSSLRLTSSKTSSHATNASFLWGEDTAITMDGSPTGTVPRRW